MDLEIPELPHKNDVTNPEKWPANRRWILEDFLKDPTWRARDQAEVGSVDPRASPRFYLVVGNKLVAVAAGKNGWNHHILPRLREILAQ